MLISEVEAHLGEEWHIEGTASLTGRARLDAIEVRTETEYYTRKERKVRYVRVTPLDNETGGPRTYDHNGQTITAQPSLVAARDITEPWAAVAERQAATRVARDALDRLYTRTHELLDEAGYESDERKPVITLSGRLSLTIGAADAIFGLLDRVGADEEG